MQWSAQLCEVAARLFSVRSSSVCFLFLYLEMRQKLRQTSIAWQLFVLFLIMMLGAKFRTVLLIVSWSCHHSWGRTA